MKQSLMLIVVVLLGGMLSASAQSKGPISFQKTTHDFGQIKKGEPAEYVFRFTNASDAPIKLTRVKASCGCTTPYWSREEIAPGAEGEIKVAYNTQRVGAFTKNVTVSYEEGARPILLYIKGEVQPTPQDMDALFKFPQGNLAFDKTSISTGVLDSDKEKELVFRVKNIGSQAISFTGQYDKEIMVEVRPDEMTLQPDQMTHVRMLVRGDRFISMGAFNKRIVLYTDDPDGTAKSLTLTGTLNKVYSPAELAQMPNIAFEQTHYDAGLVLEGEKVQVAYGFTNTGKQDLRIEAVKPSCGCTASAPRDKIIKPGERSEILATFDSLGRQGKQNKSITVHTNDPDQQAIILRLMVEVEKDPFSQGDIGPVERKQRK